MADTKSYRVKEIFYTLQGEGAQSGRPAVFCRFSKCNLWNGRESGRASAICDFCDTDFIGTDGQNGGIYTADALAHKISEQWPTETRSSDNTGIPYVVCTGGEPLLQLDEDVIEAFHQQGFEVAIETNGTLRVPKGVDWVCLSPKGKSDIVVTECDELKLVYPQPDALPSRFESIQAKHRYLQPMDLTALESAGLIASDQKSASTVRETLNYCLQHPQWKLSLQTHKWLGID